MRGVNTEDSYNSSQSEKVEPKPDSKEQEIQQPLKEEVKYGKAVQQEVSLTKFIIANKERFLCVRGW